MEAISLLLIAVGLVICFGGIYIRKFCSFSIGLIWGALLSAILIVLISGSLWRLDSDGSIVWIILGAFTLAIFSAIYDRACAFLSSFVSTFFIVSVLLMFSDIMGEDLDKSAIIVIALFLAIISGSIGYKIYDIAYMLETAFTGAFIASLGVYGLSDNAFDMVDLIFGAAINDVIGYIALGTIVLGIIGFCVQWRRFKSNKNAKLEEKERDQSNSTIEQGWICECGKHNSKEHQFCENCGRKKQMNKALQPDKTWQCKCGHINGADLLYCTECGSNRIQQEDLVNRCPICGEVIDPGMAFCPNCGNKKMQQENNTDRCPSCGGVIDPGMSFCPNCGSRKTQIESIPRNCPSCGWQVDPDMPFCPNCGSSVNGNTSSPSLK